MNFRPQLAGGILQPKPEWVWLGPIGQQQVLALISVDIEDLHRFDGAGVWNLFRLGQRVVDGLGQKIKVVVFSQKQQIGAAIAIEIAGGQHVGRELSVFNGPALGGTPAIGALIILHHQLFRLAVISQVGASVAIQIGNHKRGDALLRGNRFNTKAGIGRQLVQLALDTATGRHAIRFPGLIVEDGDFGPRIVDHDQIRQAIPIQVGGAQFADKIVDGIRFRAAEAEVVRGFGATRVPKACRAEPNAGHYCQNGVAGPASSFL